jgi:two-component system cell cycle response regulator DivK
MNSRRVLIFDDNALSIELATFVLEDAGFVVASAAAANEVASQITSFRPDLVLMDIRFGGADGLELTRALKADPIGRKVSIVAFTAFAMKGDEAKMRAAGCDGYIAKPIDVALFAQQVGDFLETPRNS